MGGPDNKLSGSRSDKRMCLSLRIEESLISRLLRLRRRDNGVVPAILVFMIYLKFKIFRVHPWVGTLLEFPGPFYYNCQ